jgi:benzoylformate decarboxylase
MAVQSVRDATFDVFREYGLTSLFANPGSTEIDLLADLPDDLRFVLGLHESAVVGMATGWALGRDGPALAILHTTAGLGNAVSALATARVNRAALVVVVGQQDRRHLASEPFLAGKLRGLAGEYPVWVDEPVRPQDVPGAVARACHEAVTACGPALVIVPMDDWSAGAERPDERAAPRRVVRAGAADPDAVAELAALVTGATSPALVAGAGAGDPDTWQALVALAEQLACPVWQESFGGRAGFPQDHPLFAGHLPADRPRLRRTLEPHDVVLVVGGPAFRQYPYHPGSFVEPGTRVAVVSNDAAEVHRSAADLAVLASPASVCAELVRLVPAREGTPPVRPAPPAPPAPPGPGEPLRAGHVFAAMAERLSRDAVVIEESPSNRPELLVRLPAREPLGSLSPAMGGLGFALPAATGLRMARPDRPVVAVVGDGSSLYSIQSLWSAAHYGAGALFVILSNGGYAIMDRLAEHHGGAVPWPGFGVDVAGLARALGCPARTVGDHDELLRTFDEVLPGLGGRDEPLLLEIAVAPDESFAP